MSKTTGILRDDRATQPSFERRLESGDCCPNCAGYGMEHFYRVDSVPVHSLDLIDDVETAVNYPRGVLDLACCQHCGFISNTQFNDPVDVDPGAYEESQGFSKTFMAFAKRVSERLVDSYRLGDKRVLEIGCGKGEFLATLAECGAGYGIGIDPVYRQGRLKSPALNRLEFHAELFDENTPRDLAPDFIACRHTLEHIPDTLDFFRMIRRYIGERNDVHLFIDVPDITRILNEGAYWDIFHEHCSYFSEPSLAMLFQHAGYNVEETWLEFNDQYLLMVGQAHEPSTEASSETRAQIDDIIAATRKFQKTASESIGRWYDTVYSRSAKGDKIAIWGSGSKCVGFLTVLGMPTINEIGCVVDINPHRQNKFMPGLHQCIVAPDHLKKYQPDLVIIMNPIYLNEITTDIHAMGLNPEIVAV